MSGTPGSLVRFASATTGGNSLLRDDGASMGVGALRSDTLLHALIPPAQPTKDMGFYVVHQSTGSRTKYGVNTYVTNTPGTALIYGAQARAAHSTGATNAAIGVHGGVAHRGSGAATGVSSRATAFGAGVADGYYAQVERYGSGYGYGLRVAMSGTGTGRKYGVYVAGEQRNYFSGKVSIGEDSTVNQLRVRGSTDWIMRVDQSNTAKFGLIEFRRRGIYFGGIYSTGNNVIYSAFTGSHFAELDESVEPGTVVALSGHNRPFSAGTSEPVYGSRRSSTANQSNVLGVFGMRVPAANDLPAHDLVNAVGNTDVWVVENGEDIAAGDPLITAHVAGHAMRDNGEFAIANVFARAAEDVDWAKVTETNAVGVKRKKISVLLDSFVINHEAKGLETRIEQLEREMRQIRKLIADRKFR